MTCSCPLGIPQSANVGGDQGRRHGFLSERAGRIVGRVPNLPQNTLKIGKNTGFWPLHSRIWGSTTPVFKSAGVRTPPPTPVGDAPGGDRRLYRNEGSVNIFKFDLCT